MFCFFGLIVQMATRGCTGIVWVYCWNTHNIGLWNIAKQIKKTALDWSIGRIGLGDTREDFFQRSLSSLVTVLIFYRPLNNYYSIYTQRNKQHLWCNTPLLKWNQLESGRHITDKILCTYTHQILWMVVITSRWQWQSLSMKWSTSVALKYLTKDHIPPWRLQWCNHRSLSNHLYRVSTKQSTQKLRTSPDWK